MEKNIPRILESIIWTQPDRYRIHAKNVAQYAKILFLTMVNTRLAARQAFGLVKHWEYIYLAFLCHDIGKFRIIAPNFSLSFSAVKFNRWEQHPQRGAAIFADLLGRENASTLMRDLCQTGMEAAASHHERWDGGGYPDGLKGEQIPIFGRMCAIANEYDKLTNPEFARGLPADLHSLACKTITEQAGSAFDPLWVEIFGQCTDKFLDYLNYTTKKADAR